MAYKLISKLINLSRELVLKANYVLDNYREVIWLIGDGRSGTTWVSDLINHDKKYREMFEPFHPKLVREMHFLSPHQYIRQFDSNEKLANISRDVISGKFTNARVDSCNRSFLYDGILIKDIFANLLCYRVVQHFPEVKPVLLIRNPFSVALSKYKKKNWFWMTEPLDFYNQSSLVEDHLSPFEGIMKKTSHKKSYILNQILIWSVINYVPLRQFEPGSIHICFYESIYKEPNQEISNIFEFVRETPENCSFDLPREVINRPSRVVGTESNILSGTSPVTSWKNELTPQLIDDGLKILQHFGFDDLYDEKSLPKMEVLRKIHESA